MVIAERADTPISIFEEPPLENRGLIIQKATETTNKFIIIPPFTQAELNRIAFARSHREFLDMNARNDNLACMFYANSPIPWGIALLDRNRAINQINSTLRFAESMLKTRMKTPWNTKNHALVFGVINYVKGALKNFEYKPEAPRAA